MKRQQKKWYQKIGWICFFLVFVFPLGIFLMWKYTRWYKAIKTLLSVIVIYWGIVYIAFCIGFIETLVGEPTKQYHNGNYTYSLPESWKEKKEENGIRSYNPKDAKVEVSIAEGMDTDVTKSSVKDWYISMYKDFTTDYHDQKVSNYHNGKFKGFRLQFKGTYEKKGSMDIYVLSYGTDVICFSLNAYDQADHDYTDAFIDGVKSLKGNKRAGTKTDSSSEFVKDLLNW